MTWESPATTAEPDLDHSLPKCLSTQIEWFVAHLKIRTCGFLNGPHLIRLPVFSDLFQPKPKILRTGPPKVGFPVL
jgi:hypothetical protein